MSRKLFATQDFTVWHRFHQALLSSLTWLLDPVSERKPGANQRIAFWVLVGAAIQSYTKLIFGFVLQESARPAGIMDRWTWEVEKSLVQALCRTWEILTVESRIEGQSSIPCLTKTLDGLLPSILQPLCNILADRKSFQGHVETRLEEWRGGSALGVENMGKVTLVSLKKPPIAIYLKYCLFLSV